MTSLYASVPQTFDPDDLLPEDELLDGIIKSVEPWAGTKYGTSEPETKAKITCEATEGEYAGKIADTIVKPSLHEKATLTPWFAAVTGITPKAGDRHDIKTLMEGKPCRFMVKYRHTTQGGVFPGIESIKAPKAPRRQRPPVDEDDDLAGA